MDGKEEPGTGRKYVTEEETKNLQILHMYDATNGVCLFSHSINSKTNEIPVAQEILKILNLKDCYETIERAHNQVETLRFCMIKLSNLKTYTTLSIVVETDDFSRFAKKEKYDSCLGIVPWGGLLW